MAPISPAQARARARIELLIRIAEPGLNLLLGAGDRLSRIVDRSDDDPVPVIRHSDDVRPLAAGRPVVSEPASE